MRPTWAVAAAVLITFGSARAAQEVTLRSGAKLIGDVKLDAPHVVVQVGEAKIVVPLADVVLIAPVGAKTPSEPDHLLQVALETFAQHGSSAQLTGLLAEAFRQAPDDPRIAFWYASSLADAQLGSEAQRILQPRRAAIEQVYPGLANRLAQRVAKLVELESLPERMRKRIEQIQAVAPNAPLDADETPMYVRFRLVDQHQAPVEQGAFRIETNGNDDRVESYGDGRYLVSYRRYQNSSEASCRLIVETPGLQREQIELHPTPYEVADARTIVVRRLDDNAKAPVRIRVVDDAGRPVTDAVAVLRPASGRDNEDPRLSAKTDGDGRAEIRAFPGPYVVSVTKEGFLGANEQAELSPDQAEGTEVATTLHGAISGSAQLVWLARRFDAGVESTVSETKLTLGDPRRSPGPYGPEGSVAVRLTQVQGEAALAIGGPPYYGPPSRDGIWTRRLSLKEASAKAPAAAFAELDLKQLEALREKGETPPQENDPRQAPPGMLMIAVRSGEIYYGQVAYRDMRNGQPATASFKVLIGELKKASDESEPQGPK